MKPVLFACICTLLATAPVQAGTIYLDKTDWLAALNGQTPTSLSLTQQSGLTTASTVVDDEVTLTFNTGRYTSATSTTGWGGVLDTLYMPNPFIGSQTDFAAPISAFGATMDFEDALTLALDSSYSFTHVPGPPGTVLRGGLGTKHFFGWIGDPTSTLVVSGHVVLSTYVLSDVQYVTAPQTGPAIVPLPPALWAGLPLLGLCGAFIHRRRTPHTR